LENWYKWGVNHKKLAGASKINIIYSSKATRKLNRPSAKILS